MAKSSNGSTPNGITNQPLPASHKVYVASEHWPDVRVAMRAIVLSSANGAHHGDGHFDQTQPAVTLYDTSGPYTDPHAETDIRKGLSALRLGWIRARGDA